MTFALDSNTIIFALRQTGSRAEAEIRARKRSELVVPSLVRAELLHGALRGRQPAREPSKVEGFLRFIRVIDFDRAAARHYAEIKKHLESIGRVIGPNDLISYGGTGVAGGMPHAERLPHGRGENHKGLPAQSATCHPHGRAGVGWWRTRRGRIAAVVLSPWYHGIFARRINPRLEDYLKGML